MQHLLTPRLFLGTKTSFPNITSLVCYNVTSLASFSFILLFFGSIHGILKSRSGKVLEKRLFNFHTLTNIWSIVYSSVCVEGSDGHGNDIGP